MKSLAFCLLAFGCCLAPFPARGQVFGPPQGHTGLDPINPDRMDVYLTAEVDVRVMAADGSAISAPILVQLLRSDGQVSNQSASAVKGHVRFWQVSRSPFKLVVVAPGYQREEKSIEILQDQKLVNITVKLQPAAGEEAERDYYNRGFASLPPKAQKNLGKAIAALQQNKLNDAQNHLDTVDRLAPNNPEVQYLLGVCQMERKEPAQAEVYWQKTLALDPRHFNALMAMAQGLLHDQKADEAMPLLKRAADVEPSSWRVHTLIAEADLMAGNSPAAIHEAQRSIDLGRGQASSAKLVLAHALAKQGQDERARQMLGEYVKENPKDGDAAKDLQAWNNGTEVPGALPAAAAFLPTSYRWMPANVDEIAPPVQSGAACALDDLLSNAGKRVEELTHDVDRFTATESVADQLFDRWGVPSNSDRKRFNYVVAIQQIRPKVLSVEEYRSANNGEAQFPDGIITNGLPSLALIFHPYYAPNYEMTCEGLTQWNGELAWQVHFRQRSDKPIMNRAYRIGLDGPIYPIALKGRAWISASNYQIVRLETDLVAPTPEIKLAAEHIAVEYGSVSFRQRDVQLWLPQSAEVYFDFRGRRIHRTHSFSDYILFAVDDKQHISAPKGADTTASDASPAQTAKP